MTKLQSLKKQALEGTTWRGHSMVAWEPHDLQPGTVAMAYCRCCGAQVTVHTKPALNGIDIHGSAVAIGCESKIKAFLQSYIECALWSSNDESTPAGGVPLDDSYGPEDIDPGTLRSMIEDCEAFYEAMHTVWRHAGLEDSQAGHDFWLTRNGHGAGFWERGLPSEAGDRLTASAQNYGDVDLYVSRKKIYA